MHAFTTTDPASGETLGSYPALSDAALDAALQTAHDAWTRHRQRPLAERADGLRRVADLLEQNADEHAALMTREMGKPLAQAKAEAEKCAWVCRYYAEHSAAFLADEPAETEAEWSGVAFEPLGPVLAIMPWNFPYWQAMRFAAPAVMAGNVGLLKHAENVLGCGDALAQLFHDAGFERGVFQHIIVPVEKVDGIIHDRRVAAVTLTGSERAGRAVGKAAGEALKPCVLELGGSDAFVVLDDADLDRAVEIGVASRTQNNGQSCIAAKRFILHRDIANAFTERFVAAMEALTVGDPTQEATDLGPLAREDLRDGLQDQVSRARAEGAEVLTGGEIPSGEGWYYPPTVLAGVTERMLPFREELFGPVASLTVAEDEADAIRLANATRFGLGGAVFTGDRARGERVARQMASGAVFVNQMTKSHPALPFGGIGASGVGRELARQGIRSFVNQKTIWIEG
ncbi:NAD-dependent succinate-semialdehyde dehydrogenase [Rubricoccus marinus]|uniref:NADP-dependent succinic semialdehyde dehydrogenase n=1 Tax=Rubricoccus marinus TaxID=716817 RepID=A0A259TUW4_9BACT|nr:NAD-dependent succinate-semialdehyde dehydrogenase [Rubricoccus marinus]OZC01533.1 NADP-dependent succinic semialdehyde dehydrogenase [Rubricoccus marinus]